MENSYRFYENRKCKYYPCHEGLEQINCMFCFCPLYPFERCLGNYVTLSDKGVLRKDCSKCIFPHNPDNYETIIEFIRLNENKNKSIKKYNFQFAVSSTNIYCHDKHTIKGVIT